MIVGNILPDIWDSLMACSILEYSLKVSISERILNVPTASDDISESISTIVETGLLMDSLILAHVPHCQGSLICDILLYIATHP
jgi:hypothetical protein